MREKQNKSNTVVLEIQYSRSEDTSLPESAIFGVSCAIDLKKINL